MKETGRVVSVEEGVAKVEFVPKEECEHCGAKGFCHPSRGKMLADALDELGAETGDEVTIETDVGASILAAVLVFLVPVVGLIAGYLFARWYWGSEGAGVIGAVFLMVVTGGILAYIDRRFLRPRRFMPHITSVTRREVTAVAKDVVCGMDVSEDTQYKTEHDGKTYHFCCEACKVSFEKNPDEYIERQ